MISCCFKVNMFVKFVLILVGVLLIQESATRECNIETELPCDDGQCISDDQWCDHEYDCADGSDEHYCSGGCLPNHFPCENGKCVPDSAVCNGKDNCGDASDEYCNSPTEPETLSSAISDKELVKSAANYILSKRESDYGWGSFTPRAIIALTLAEKVWPILEKDKVLMKKRLDIQILLSLKQKNKQYNLVELSFFVNALYALCDDPRNFHGMDLVGLLRSETDDAMRSNFRFPIVLMTLCLAKEAKPHDFKILDSMFNSHDDRGFRALALMAMEACSKELSFKTHDFKNRTNEFVGDVPLPYRSLDVYNTALIQQALRSLGFDVSHLRNYLLIHRRSDGSFGDLLATYYAIPVLMSTSLLNLKCKERNYEEMLIGNSFSKDHFEKEISYSLRIGNGEDLVSHTLSVTIDGNKTFYDVMKLAERRDPRYRFSFEETAKGKKIYSLGGLPNDAETCMQWTLFKGESDGVLRNSKYLKEEIKGVDRIFPENGNHFVFWMKRTPN